jgi:hypothetical protein
MLQHPGTPVAPAQLQTLRAQNAAPGRIPVQAISTKQVHPVTPTVRPGPAPTFAQRPAQPQNRPGQPLGQKPNNQPVPAARPQNLPPAREQAQPPRPQAQPQRQTPPPRKDEKKAEEKNGSSIRSSSATGLPEQLSLL